MKPASRPESYERVILGHLASKSNGRRKTTWGGVIKSKVAMEFEDDFFRQTGTSRVPLDGPLGISVTVYYADNRRDLDISLLQDCLQKANFILNDRQIVEIHALRKIDRKKPRVDFRLYRKPDYLQE